MTGRDCEPRMTTEQMDEKDAERSGRSRWPLPPGSRASAYEPDQGNPCEDDTSDLVGLKPDTDYHVRVNAEGAKLLATMAAEPREHAERRQWLDGYLQGFREGFERAGYIGRGE
jgi:hypothetical protein